MKVEIRCRLAEKRDTDTLVHFIVAMALETESKILSPATVTSGVLRLLNNPQYGFYVVAENSSEITGALMITPEWSDWRNKVFWWIQSVYVKPEFRRRGIYTKLFQYIKSSAISETKVCGLRLYVAHNNAVAQKTYSALGMNVAPYYIFEDIIT